MARRLGARYGFGQALECKDCHDPAPDGARFQPVDMEQDCAMCHSLAFDRSRRHLAHPSPRRAGAGGRGSSRLLSRPRRRRCRRCWRRRRGGGPGDAPDLRNRIQFAARSRAAPSGRSGAVFSPGGACFDCHQVERAAARLAQLPDPAGRLPDPLPAQGLVRPPPPRHRELLELPRRRALATRPPTC